MPFALAFTVVLGLLAVFQLALVLGAPLGHFAWGGKDRVLPAGKRLASLVAILVYAVMALIAWDRIGFLQVFPDLFSVIAMWVVFAYLLFGVLANLASRSRPERLTMTPVSLLLAVLAFLVAIGFGSYAVLT